MATPQPIPELISAYEFAKRKGVDAMSVYYRIDKGEIDTIPIGKYKYIDWEKFSHIEFPHAERINNGTSGRAKKPLML